MDPVEVILTSLQTWHNNMYSAHLGPNDEVAPMVNIRPPMGSNGGFVLKTT